MCVYPSETCKKEIYTYLQETYKRDLQITTCALHNVKGDNTYLYATYKKDLCISIRDL